MIRSEASIVIDAPVDRVWEFMSDLGTMVQWNPGVLKVEYQRPLGVGSTAVVTAKSLLRSTSTVEVDEWERGRKFAFHGKIAGIRVKVTCAMEPIYGNKTRLIRSVQSEVGGLMRLLSPLVSYRTKRALSTQVGKIRGIVEGLEKSA